MLLLLLVAAPIYLAIGDTFDAVVTFTAVIPIAAVGILLEGRSERTLQRLRQMTAPTAIVRRDGNDVSVSVEEVVVGDVIQIREGDVVAADGHVVDGTQLLVDESSLTGESVPIEKSVTGNSHETQVRAGTTVLSGRALIEVDATGPRTEYAAIGQLVASIDQPNTPLQRSVRRLVWAFASVAAVFVAGVVAVELIRGHTVGRSIIAGVSLAIAALPEEFPMVYTLYLGLGAWRLAREHALVRRLPGVETLGSTTVICTDKTGTVTEGRMAVGAVFCVDESSGEEKSVLRAAVLASEPDPFDPLERALLTYATAAQVAIEQLHAYELVADYPFDPADKYVTHVWQRADGRILVAAKGSLEGVLAHAKTGPAQQRAVHEAHERLAASGMRVLAVAAGEADRAAGSRADDEVCLELVGLVAFSDPVRVGVAEALAECRAAGIRVVLITGDHPMTAHAVVEALDLPHTDDAGTDRLATGTDIDAASDAELDELVRHTNVFARTQPGHKHRLVAALRRGGEVVAMTGDGINDAPALREADIGVAMGARGTEVARSAATIVLLDDNFATIVRAVREGRRIFDQLQRAFAYLVAFHPPLLLVAFIVPLLDRPLMLLPIHLVLLELVLHPVVSLVFETDPPDPDLMVRPPRSASTGLIGSWLWRPLAVGITLAAGVLATYLFALERLPAAESRAVGFTTLMVGQLVIVLVERSPRHAVWRRGSTPITGVVAAIAVAFVGVLLVAIYVGPIARVLRFETFPATWWPGMIAVAILTTTWSEFAKQDRRVGASQTSLTDDDR
jgi:P-type Ca2+ transporter type 2C